MTNRPLKDKRIIGPVFDYEDESEQNEESEVDSAIVEQAENWYQSVSDEKTKRKMMIEYINGITDDSVDRAKAKRMVENSNI